jgi:hypothetical protein
MARSRTDIMAMCDGGVLCLSVRHSRHEDGCHVHLDWRHHLFPDVTSRILPQAYMKTLMTVKSFLGQGLGASIGIQISK